ARELPPLAIEHVVHDADPDAVVDDRAIAMLVRELDGARPERAAEVLARLHRAGQVDAVGPLTRAAIARGGAPLWRALIAVLDRPAERHGPAIAAALLTAARSERELAVRARGLAGGAAADAVEPWRTSPDPALALTAESAQHRLAGRAAAVLPTAGDAIRDGGGAARAALDELTLEIALALAAGGESRSLSTSGESRTLRRGRGDPAGRAAGFAALAEVVARVRDRRSAELSLLRADLLELARDRVETAASPPAPPDSLTSLVRPSAAADDAAPEVAAALRLLGALLDGADLVEPDDLRRIARALGEPDDAVRAAAEHALVALGSVAAGELIATAAWGRRRARDRAAALLAELPVTPAAIFRLVDAELDALDRTHAALAALTAP